MKHLLLYIFLFALKVNSIAQTKTDLNAIYKQPEFKTNAPLWTYTVFDSTNIGFPVAEQPGRITNGYNMVTYARQVNWAPVIEDDFLYACTPTMGTTIQIFGGILYRINLKTGHRDWIEVFDNRLLDRQEYPHDIDIIGDTLRLTTLKRFTDYKLDIIPTLFTIQGDSTYVCTRKYNKHTGELYSVYCWDKDNPNTPKVYPNTNGWRVLAQNNDNSFNYIDDFLVYSKSRDLYILDPSGNKLYYRVDTMEYDTIKYPDKKKISGIAPLGIKINILKTDTILMMYNYKYNENGLLYFPTDLCYIQMYDKAYNKTGRISTDNLLNTFAPDFVDFSIRAAYSDHILLSVPSEVDSRGFLVVIDYEGNIISSAEYHFGDQEFMLNSGFLEYSEKPYLITRSWGTEYPREIPQILKYYIFENGNWELKFSQELGDNHFFDRIRYATETPGRDLIFCASHRYYYEDIDRSTTLDTDMWMLMDGTKLGIKTSTKDEHIANKLTLYPNPTTNTVTIADLDAPAKVDVYNLNGALVSTYDNVTSEVHIGQLPSGMYIFDISNRYVSEKHKVVRME